MFEGVRLCDNGFEEWSEMIPKEAGVNRVAMLPFILANFFPEKGWFCQHG